ncbi:hypothetical protein Q0P46_14555, partial [Staphylococcus aureus]|nr:hypothetical protein [Staphylococcus aureus]
TKLVPMTLAFRGDNPRQYDPSTGKVVGLLERPEPMGTTYYVNHQELHKHNGKMIPASDVAARAYYKKTDRKGEDGK